MEHKALENSKLIYSTVNKTLPIFFTFLLTYGFSYAQTFKLTDTAFSPGLTLVRGQVFNPDCQIDLNSFPFIDSLAKFLIANEHIAIEISFHTDIRGTPKANQLRTEFYGKYRLSEMFAGRYPTIKKEKIRYVCNGESKPIYTENAIKKITDKVKKQRAHNANARTVIKILQIDFQQ